MEIKLHTFLLSPLDGGEWSASCPGQFTPRQHAPTIRRTGSCRNMYFN